MNSISKLLSAGLVSLCSVATVPAADFVWLEAESTAAPIPVTSKMDGSGHKEFLSGDKWLQISIAPDKVDSEVPDGGVLLQYDVKVTGDAKYEIWNRIGFEFVRSPFEWRIDGGEWTAISPEMLTTDLMELDFWCEVAWLKIGDKELKAGPHKLEIRLPKSKDSKGKTANILYCSDALCLYPGTFQPNSKFKPGETRGDPIDAAAAKTVFELPAPASPGVRTTVELKGAWEICRDDEQMPGEVAAPIAALPARQLWTGIEVPGDKNTLRPDLLFAHRLWYRTRVQVPTACAGRSFFITFPMNSLNTTVYVNGMYCGFNKNPFARFDIDVTQAIKPGVNEVWVGIRDAWYAYTANPANPLKLRKHFNFPPVVFTRGFADLDYPIWVNHYSGLLEAPQFVAAGVAYVADVFVKPSVLKKQLAAEITLANPSAKPVTGELQWQAGTKTFASHPFTLAAGANQTLSLVAPWTDPKLWWPDDPQMQALRVTVNVAGQPVDVSETPFGFREWTINGTDFKLNGVVWPMWADITPLNANSKESCLQIYRQTHQRTFRMMMPGHIPSLRCFGMPLREALDFFDRNGVVVRRNGMPDGEGMGYMIGEGDPDLIKRNGTVYKAQLMQNWKDQMLQQVKAERNHPSIQIWTIENEFAYVNVINLGGPGPQMDYYEKAITAVSDAVQVADPTRSVMIDGGGATRLQTLPVHGSHYITGPVTTYPALAYDANPEGGGRNCWTWDQKRPRFMGEDFFMTGNHPEVSYFGGDEAFLGKSGARRGTSLWMRMLQQGYRWTGFGGWQFWLGADDTDGSPYIDFAPRAVFCRQWDWTFGSSQKVPRTFKIFNDTRFADPLTFTWTLTLNGKTVASHSSEHQLAAGTREKFDETLVMPKVKARTEGELTLILTAAGKEVFKDTKAVTVLPPARCKVKDLIVFDPSGIVGMFLKECGAPFTPVASLEALPATGKVLIVGPNALDEASSTSSRLAAYAAGGRRVIVLEQKNPLHYQGLPAEMELAQNAGSTAFIEDGSHPVARGLKSQDFFAWAPDELVYHNAYVKPTRGARSLIQCDSLLGNSALVEVPVAEGLLVLCQINTSATLTNNAVAQQLVVNLIDYAAQYKVELRSVAAAVGDAPLLAQTLDAMGLQYTKADTVLAALGGARIAVVSASPANLKTLAANLDKVKAFTDAGGWMVFNGLTPEGLADYNKIVGVEHLIRPFSLERVTFTAPRHPLTAGLTSADISLYSSKRIFSFQDGNYVVPDAFSFVVDYDEVAPFGKSSFFAYDKIVNGFVSADGWPLIIDFHIPDDGKPFSLPITLPRTETITELTYKQTVNYNPTTKIAVLFDGRDRQEFTLPPNGEAQTFAITPPRQAKELTIQTCEWQIDPTKGRNQGIDNIWIKVQRSPEFQAKVKPMLNVGGLMAYPRGTGGFVLCNLLFKPSEEVPENTGKKRLILATILHNLKASFAGGKTIIAGAPLRYESVELSKQANAFRNEKGWFGDAKFTFRDLPTGKHVFAGVTFDVYEFATSPVPTILMHGGPGVPGSLPAAIRGIPVNRKADALFFLQAAHLVQRRSAAECKANKKYELARYIVNYADGQTESVPVYAEINVDEYSQKTPLALPGAQIAWTRPYEGTEFSAVAYSMQWTNPRPGIEIKSVDLESGHDQRGGLALLAVTTATAP